ncbi:bifunctional aminoglycoside phosphotransferase/ATP-binding protein [Hydrogenophaga intermedia]|uniref:bifunctional aminoglycoside phosphotransferase/ATP-binding protein n=1 Tax=Hydrogenophaga intermedia TaxID=65786 RepID=UPI002043F0F2|nr:hypothetical protein [Hydrogenophaga intermedia]
MSAPGVGANEALAQAGALVRSLAARLSATLIETHISWVLLAGEPEIDARAERLARLQREAPVAPADSGFASPVQRAAVAMAALQGAAPLCSVDETVMLSRWLGAQSLRLAAHWAARLRGGHVRECHGDLHLDNLIAIEGGVEAFDGIEFDPALRWIDVIGDIAFVVMDLHAQGRADLAFRLLNAWLDATGEHPGLPGLRQAMVYRALARRARVPWRIVHCEAPADVLRTRLRKRRGDASEADEGTLEMLQGAQDPLTDEEGLRVEDASLLAGDALAVADGQP